MMDSIELIIYILIFIAFVVIITIFIWMSFKFKHRVVIRELTGGKKIITIDKARDFKEEGKVTFWQRNREKDKEKRLMPIPPEEAIEVTAKGKKYVEAYLTATGEYIYICDKARVDKFPEDYFHTVEFKEHHTTTDILNIADEVERNKLMNAWKNQIRDKWKNRNNVVEAYQPLSTNQRSILISNIKKAEMRKMHKWTEHLPMIISLGVLGIVVIALFIFWGDIAKPAIEARQIGLEEAKIRQDNLELLRDLKTGQQTIKSALGVKETNEENG